MSTCTCTCTCTNYLYVAYTSLLGPPTCPSINQDPTFTQPQQRQGGAEQGASATKAGARSGKAVILYGKKLSHGSGKNSSLTRNA